MMHQKLEEIFHSVVDALGYAYPTGVVIEEPPAGVQADVATNLAMQLAHQEKLSPSEVAERVKLSLDNIVGIITVEVAGPGFLNIRLADMWFSQIVDQANQPAVEITDKHQRILVEYVSANPTGPLHIGNARGGPLGETICAVLEREGNHVEREFYVNDIGGQADLFAQSVMFYYLQFFGTDVEFPEKGYPGEYIEQLAKEIADEDGDMYAHLHLPDNEQLKIFRSAAIKRMVDKIKDTCERMGIRFNRWYWQSSLVESGASARTLKMLREKDATLEKDGAIWLKSGITEDDRESVLVKSNGEGTYFLDDIAYHYEKLTERGFDKAVVLLGANHSGHIPRMKAAMQALGLDPERYVGVLYQYVQLKQDGETMKMAKREGTFVTADQVLNEVPAEVFAYFMLTKSNETHIDFDLQLAKDTSEKNPIYYVHYAHARIHSLLEQGEKRGLSPAKQDGHSFNPAERRLIYWLGQFDAVVKEVAITYRTHLLAHYVYELATRFHTFYAGQRIITDDAAASQMQLLFSQLTAHTLKKGLALMGIEAKDRM